MARMLGRRAKQKDETFGIRGAGSVEFSDYNCGGGELVGNDVANQR